MSAYTETWLAGPSDTQFYTRTYAAPDPKAVLLFLHGYAEHCGRYEHIHPRYARRGITVFTLDQRGFGRTALDEEHKSPESAFAHTSWPQQFVDIEWAVKHVHAKYPDLPLFLMGHSMGAALPLGFVTRESEPPAKATVALISGIISSSPLVLETTPTPKLLRWAGTVALFFNPWVPLPAKIEPDWLSHDLERNEANRVDPLVRQVGTIRCLGDMLSGGEDLLYKAYQRWPENLPVLFAHGTEDKITSYKATEAFYEKIPAKDKTLSLYQSAYHELQSENDGVKEKVADECIAFVLAHLPSAGTVPATN